MVTRLRIGGVMLAALLVLLNCLTVKAEVALPTVTWHLFQPKYAELGELGGEVTSEEAFISVPQDYFGETTSRMDVRVRRYRQESSQLEPSASGHSKSVWLIPGGPGQHSNDVEYEISLYLSIFPPGTTLYLMDHRGTGKSAKIVSSKRQEWCLENLEECAKESAVPWKYFSPNNAAMDFVLTTQAINASKDQDWYLYGASYGALLVTNIHKLSPKLFKGIIADSWTPELRPEPSLSNDIRQHIASNCSNSEDCSKWIESSKIPQLIGEILNNENQCSDSFFYSLKRILGIQLKSMPRSLKARAIRLLIRTILLTTIGRQPQASVLAFLKSTCECKDIGGYNGAVNTLLRGLYGRAAEGNQSRVERIAGWLDRSKNSFTSSTPLLDDDIFADDFLLSKKALKRRNSRVLFELMMVSEQTASDFKACFTRSEVESKFLDVCDIRAIDLSQHMRWNSLRYNPQQIIQNEESSTRYILLATKIDTQTPYERAQEAFDEVKAKEKFMFVYDGMPHVVFARDSPCDPLIVQMLFGDGEDTELKLRQCIRKHDSDKAITRKGVHPLLLRLWDQHDRSHITTWLKMFGYLSVSVMIPVAHAITIAIRK